MVAEHRLPPNGCGGEPRPDRGPRDTWWPHSRVLAQVARCLLGLGLGFRARSGSAAPKLCC